MTVRYLRPVAYCLFLALVGAVGTFVAAFPIGLLMSSAPRLSVVLAPFAGGAIVGGVEASKGGQRVPVALAGAALGAVLLGLLSYLHSGDWILWRETFFLPVGAGWATVLWPKRITGSLPA